MQPRTSEGSASSAARMTCWYHSGKSSSRRGEIALFVAAAVVMANRNKAGHEQMTSEQFSHAAATVAAKCLQPQSPLTVQKGFRFRGRTAAFKNFVLLTLRPNRLLARHKRRRNQCCKRCDTRHVHQTPLRPR